MCYNIRVQVERYGRRFAFYEALCYHAKASSVSRSAWTQRGPGTDGAFLFSGGRLMGISYKEQVAFRGYTGINLDEAIESYRKAVRKVPRLVLIGSSEAQMDLNDKSDVADKKPTLILLTHQVDASTWQSLRYSGEDRFGRFAVMSIAGEVQDDDECEQSRDYRGLSYEEQTALLVAEANRQRRELTTGACPVCQQKIQGSRFEKLGHWPGWATGITPDYWQALRLYVFERDSYTCQRCRKHFSDTSKLRAHHIHRKEDGGKDNAKNLTTLCADCHKDEHPIFPLDDELEAAIERMVDREF